MFIITIYKSSHVVARLLKTKIIKGVLSNLLDIYFTFGVPTSIQHDKGKEFTSQVMIIIFSIVLLNNSTSLFTYSYKDPKFKFRFRVPKFRVIDNSQNIRLCYINRLLSRRICEI